MKGCIIIFSVVESSNKEYQFSLHASGYLGLHYYLIKSISALVTLKLCRWVESMQNKLDLNLD